MTERSQRILDDLKARQRAGEYMVCPRCGMDVMKTPVHTNALSRAADIYICDACGSTEAMLAYMHQSSPLSGWAAFRPKRLSCDLQARPAGEALPEIVGRQMAELTRIYRLCRDDPDNAEWYRLEAFESCPASPNCGRSPFRRTTAPTTARWWSASKPTRPGTSRWRRTSSTNRPPSIPKHRAKRPVLFLLPCRATLPPRAAGARSPTGKPRLIQKPDTRPRAATLRNEKSRPQAAILDLRTAALRRGRVSRPDARATRSVGCPPHRCDPRRG